jgi:hypothetical protein
VDSIAVFYPDQRVLHGDRRATFLCMSRGAAIIRYWGDSHAVCVPPEALTLAPRRIVAKSRRSLMACDERIAREGGAITRLPMSGNYRRPDSPQQAA